MDKEFKKPPQSPDLLTPPNKIADKLSSLVGQEFELSGKTRTDGSRIRKLVAATLAKTSLPEAANEGEYEIVPQRNKGVPKMIREFIDTYIITTGKSYNLQIWNRLPTSRSLLIKYENGESLKCSDVRLVFVKIDKSKEVITSIVVLTPDYIEENFGEFGTPTIKHQLLISGKARKKIYEKPDKILFFPDTEKLTYYVNDDYEPPESNMVEEPKLPNLYSLCKLPQKLDRLKL